MKKSDLTSEQKLFVPCPVCAAGAGEQCKMYSGFGPRNEAHPERKFFVMEALEHDDGGGIQSGRTSSAASSNSS
jgi:hypothetical protein